MKMRFMLGTFVLAAVVLGMAAFVYADEPVNSSAGCHTLYWFDSVNKSCSQKEFCGAYMYQGLRTFESRGECQSELNDSRNNESREREENESHARENESENENENHSFTLSNGRKAAIKVLPSTASATAVARLTALGFNVTLKDVGNNWTLKEVQGRAAYAVESEKDAKVLGVFKTKATIETDVDAETGDVVAVKRPWWSFMASGV